MLHLYPIDRRCFLGGVLAGGAGLLSPHRLLAQTPPVDPNYFALLADIHVGERRDQGLIGGNSAERLEQAIGKILALAPRPAGAIVAGDCAYLHGKAGDYAMLGELLKPLRQAGVPVYFALGNHDHRERFLAAFPEAKARAAVEPKALNKYVAVLETPHANWFLLDSLNSPNARIGLLGEAQLAWLAQALDARLGKPALILAHHPPDPAVKPTGLPDDFKKSNLTDSEAFFKVIVPRKQVKAFFYGHVHQWRLDRHMGIHLASLPSVLCGLGSTLPYGFVTVQLRPDGATLVLLLHELGRKHPKYGEKIDLAWRE